MASELEQRLQFAYGLLFDAVRWLEQIDRDAPSRIGLVEALDHVRQAQGYVEQAKMAVRQQEEAATAIILAVLDALEEES